jgi:hypothetical protein
MGTAAFSEPFRAFEQCLEIAARRNASAGTPWRDDLRESHFNFNGKAQRKTLCIFAVQRAGPQSHPANGLAVTLQFENGGCDEGARPSDRFHWAPPEVIEHRTVFRVEAA